jgi:flagellin-like protein
MINNKKGISPLIATVLLVAFAVALAAVVMNWNTAFLKDTSEHARTESETRVSCTLDMGLKVHEIYGEQQICHDSGQDRLEIVLENSKRNTIEDVKIRISTNQSVYGPYSLEGPLVNKTLKLEKGSAVKAWLNDSLYNGSIEKITLFPGILVNDDVKLCLESAINIDGPIDECK